VRYAWSFRTLSRILAAPGVFQKTTSRVIRRSRREFNRSNSKEPQQSLGSEIDAADVLNADFVRLLRNNAEFHTHPLVRDCVFASSTV